MPQLGRITATYIQTLNLILHDIFVPSIIYMPWCRKEQMRQAPGLTRILSMCSRCVRFRLMAEINQM